MECNYKYRIIMLVVAAEPIALSTSIDLAPQPNSNTQGVDVTSPLAFIAGDSAPLHSVNSISGSNTSLASKLIVAIPSALTAPDLTALPPTKDVAQPSDPSAPPILSFTQTEQAIEAIRPVGKHPANFRHFKITVNGHPIKMALLAHPELYGSPYGDGAKKDTGIDSRAAIKKLHAGEYHTLIALDHFEYDVIKDRFDAISKTSAASRNIFLCHIEDLEASKPKDLQEVFDIVSISASKGSNIAFYCGAGFGRSGLLAASLKLREIIDQENNEAISSGKTLSLDLEKTVDLPDIRKKIIRTTRRVAQAIIFIREQDPEQGNNLRTYNARSSLEGPSIENQKQFLALEELEAKLCSEIRTARPDR